MHKKNKNQDIQDQFNKEESISIKDDTMFKSPDLTEIVTDFSYLKMV